MVLKNFLEFVLLKEQVDSKFALVKKSVHFLFDVTLQRVESLETQDKERCWVKVEGNEDDIHRAKVRGIQALQNAAHFWQFCTFLYFKLLH